jgi:putative transposase
MSKKRTVYTTEFKTKLVLEVLKGDQTINEIASAHNVIPKNLINWKATFLANAEMAMEPSKAVKEYKDEIAKKEQEIEVLQKTVGKITVERDWLEGKLVSLGSSDHADLIEPKLETLSISRQCELLKVNRSSLYYEPKLNEKKELIMEHLQVIHTLPYLSMYGSLKVHQQLLEDGFNISVNSVAKYRKELGLKAVLAVKTINTSIPIQEHPKHSYKLRGLEITHANHVWSTDITYVKIKGGFVYLAAVIDWYSKAILSFRISNTMDQTLTMDVLNDALRLHGNPQIFNTDQGSQYTSHAHTGRLLECGIEISMDGKGRATDNICIERFWRSAKCERIYLNEYNTIKELKEDVKEYIHFYNHKRFHQSLEYKKPMAVYLDSLKTNNEEYSDLALRVS